MVSYMSRKYYSLHCTDKEEAESDLVRVTPQARENILDISKKSRWLVSEANQEIIFFLFKLPQQCGKSFQQKLIIYCFAPERIKKSKTKQTNKKPQAKKQTKTPQKQKNRRPKPDRQTWKQTTEQSSRKSHHFIFSQKRDWEQMLRLFYTYCGFLDICFLSAGKEGDALPSSKVGV